jgi:phosphohistidine phosphatase
MKTIYFIRHAKAAWPKAVHDFERPLENSGEEDAKAMAQTLVKENIIIDTFITSPAKRAKQTCMVFAKAYNKEMSVIPVTILYNSSLATFYETISLLEDSDNNVAIFAHNPGITEMVCTQTNPMTMIDMPTCGVAAFSVDINSWEEYVTAEKKFLFFKAP